MKKSEAMKKAMAKEKWPLVPGGPRTVSSGIASVARRYAYNTVHAMASGTDCTRFLEKYLAKADATAPGVHLDDLRAFVTDGHNQFCLHATFRRRPDDSTAAALLDDEPEDDEINRLEEALTAFDGETFAGSRLIVARTFALAVNFPDAIGAVYRQVAVLGDSGANIRSVSLRTFGTRVLASYGLEYGNDDDGPTVYVREKFLKLNADTTVGFDADARRMEELFPGYNDNCNY